MPLVYAKQIYTKNRELPYFVWGIREMFFATIYLALLCLAIKECVILGFIQPSQPA